MENSQNSVELIVYDTKKGIMPEKLSNYIPYYNGNFYAVSSRINNKLMAIGTREPERLFEKFQEYDSSLFDFMLDRDFIKLNRTVLDITTDTWRQRCDMYTEIFDTMVNSLVSENSSLHQYKMNVDSNGEEKQIVMLSKLSPNENLYVPREEKIILESSNT